MIRLYLITPQEGDPAPAVEAALSVLPRGAAGVQLRQRLSARQLLERARTLRAICTKFAAPLLVNDRADIAIAGVDAGNAARCIDAGARGVACIRAVLGAADPAAAAIALWKAIVLALLLCALPARADDSRYQDYPVGSRALALGGAFVALSDDPSGLYYNPAGICDSRRLNVSVSASLYGIERQNRGAI